MVQIHSPRPFFPSRFNVLDRVCCCRCRPGSGYIGYNIGFARRKFKTQADLFCCFFSVLNVLSQLRVSVSYRLVRVAEPETV